MVWDVCTQSEHIARKDYHCDACDWAFQMIGEQIFSFADLRQLVKAKREGWKIKKGQKYIKVSGKWEGEWCVFRARPEINNLCQKHEIYQE